MWRTWLVALALLLAAKAQAPSFAALRQPPRGLPPMPLPNDYVPSAAMFDLGQRLFHDKLLSRDHSVACANCHVADKGFADGQTLPVGIGGQLAKRHAPVLWNRGYGTLQRWDGASASLEAFVLEPIADAREMGFSVAGALARLANDQSYQQAFQTAFAQPPSEQGLQRALATFVRGIVRGDSSYDRFLQGETQVQTAAERAGQWVFESKGGCWRCHTPPLFTDEAFHNTGIGVRDGKPEAGRFAATGRDADQGAFKTPTLRGVGNSAPFMHDGSVATLEDVLEFYDRGGNANTQLDRALRPLHLTDSEKRHLAAFLRSL